jgi:hypothetical protein
MPVGECPGVVATAARRIVTISDGGGRQEPPVSPYGVVFLILRILSFVSPQQMRSCCLWRWWTQVAASQRRWSPRPNGETPVGECPGRRHGDGGTNLWLDGGGAWSSVGGRRWWWWQGRRLFDGDGPKLCDYCNCSSIRSMFFLSLFQ